jgi:hypothetical protein
MDMRRHLRPWLNDAALARLGGVFDGVIASVVEEVVRNRFSAQRETQPVLVFADGHRLIPNYGMRAALIEIFGAETDGWIGRRVRVVRVRRESVDRTTGEVRERFVKVVECADRHARIPFGAPSVAPEREWADYDDSPEALAAAESRRRK